jgi:hypothetical protein
MTFPTRFTEFDVSMFNIANLPNRGQAILADEPLFT